MQQPKSNSKKDIEDFLIWCSKNDQIKVWNKWRNLSPDTPINLGNANLTSTDLIGANLENAHLRGADLSNADLSKAYLNNTNLIGADLSDANLTGANLQSANLTFVNLIGANLIGANLMSANLKVTSIDGAILDGMNARLFDQQYLIPNVDKAKILSLLKQVRSTIEELEKTKSKSGNESEKLKQEVKKAKFREKELLEKLQSLEEKNQETENINEIIGYLGKIPEEISSEQTYSIKRRDRFTLFATLMFSGGIIVAIGFIINTICGNYLNLPAITNAGQYLAYALSVAFPMVLSFLFQRQANIKSREIDKINEKSIIIQQVENALNAYNVLLSGNRLEDKTIGSIDRVLDKLFENGHEQSNGTDTKEPKASIGDLQKFIKTISDVAKH